MPHGLRGERERDLYFPAPAITVAIFCLQLTSEGYLSGILRVQVRGRERERECENVFKIYPKLLKFLEGED